MHTRRSESLNLLSVILLLALLLAQGAGTSPARAANWLPLVPRPGQLKIATSRAPAKKTVCRNTNLDLGFLVSDDALKTPEEGVDVTLTNETDGYSITGKTSAIGSVDFPIYLLNTGAIEFQVTAKKADRTPDAMKFSYNVIHCKWIVRVYFTESYTLADNADIMVTAESDWKGVLTAEPGEGDAPAKVSSGMWTGDYTYDGLVDELGPLMIVLNPPVSGQFEREVSGTLENNILKLHFTTYPFKSPGEVSVDLLDKLNHYKFLYHPKVPISDKGGMCLEQSNATDVTLSADGGMKSFPGGESCFFAVNKLAFRFMGISVEPVKGGGTYLPGTAYQFSSGGQQ